MKVQLSDERRWCLSWWRNGGWSMGRPADAHRAKWKHHIRMLVKAGLLEDGGHDTYRITPAGREALTQGETR